MTETQKKYIDFFSKVKEELSKTNLPEEVMESFHLDETIETIENVELTVPVIGAFSAGKSSLINSFLGQRVLPEKITPETALATELRYSEDERIVAYDDDGHITKFPIDATEEIKNRANELKFLRLYLKNENIKNIEPLILVDMPGFESPLDLHNRAIMEYVNKGVHFIVLSSVEDGTITKSMKRELENISQFQRDFSFFLSKTNLKSKEEIQEIKEEVQDQLEDLFDKHYDIGLLDDKGGESLQKVLSKIDPEELVKKLFLEQLKDQFFSIKETINTNITALSKSKEENAKTIRELKKSLEEIIQKKNELIENAKNKYSDIRVNRIVDAVGRDLSESIDEIVSVGLSAGPDELSKTILEIAKSSLISNVKKSMSDISDDVINDFSVGLSDLNDAMSGFSLSENWLEGVADTTKKMVERISNGLDSIVENRQKSPRNRRGAYRTITSVIAITTKILTPLLELIIVFLPDILDVLYKKKREEKIRNIILTNTIPSLKRKLRAELPMIFEAQVNELILQIGEQFEEAIKEKQAAIENAQKEIEENNSNIDAVIKAYEDADDAITTLANNTLYKER